MYPFFYRPADLSLEDQWGLSTPEKHYAQMEELVRNMYSYVCVLAHTCWHANIHTRTGMHCNQPETRPAYILISVMHTGMYLHAHTNTRRQSLPTVIRAATWLENIRQTECRGQDAGHPLVLRVQNNLRIAYMCFPFTSEWLDRGVHILDVLPAVGILAYA